MTLRFIINYTINFAVLMIYGNLQWALGILWGNGCIAVRQEEMIDFVLCGLLAIFCYWRMKGVRV